MQICKLRGPLGEYVSCGKELVVQIYKLRESVR